MIGSHLADAAPIPVAVHGPAGVDHASITFASALAAEQERRLVVVTVTEPLMMGPPRDYSVEACERDLAAVHASTTAAMQVLVEEIKDESPELAVSGQTVQGHATEAFRSVIGETNPALVVVGNHHHSAPVAMISDSVLGHLPPLVQCPVVAVPVT